ncbi:type II secretion system F family protein [Candidatus Venteria ishoeyi]|uniref:Type II secretion system protein F n=1 Tax=Candidatus Venteria ishoeyi TaxID=1899563 RepID=A0A1H6FE73_9GAMM|nr:type II secretion system F family protein [Candidatus Venteria ishoeyi]MDM8546947.1 type II secretion system F family protein [Candidatus Venteria ishoeyi]SEH07466.1 Type II secretion system protein F [Candidatus Venteria ishoeyi]
MAAKNKKRASGPQAIVFVWEGKNRSGQKTKGEKSGTSEAMVRALLRREGITPGKVKKKSKPLFGEGFGGGGTITTADISIFARQLATMMASGVPLIQAFEIVGQGHDNPAMRKLIYEIKNDVEAGGTLAEALRKHPDQFDTLFCNLVEAGEQAGILEDLLGKIASYKEKSEGMKKKIKKALGYPIAVLIVAFVITAILMIFVVPVFADLFMGFGAALPAPTQFIMMLSNAFVAYWYLIFGSIIGLVMAFKQAKKRITPFRHMTERLSLKLPLFGEILTKSAIARFARTLATMFAAGTPLVESMDSVAGATGNIVYVEALLKVKEEVSAGTGLAVSLRDTGVFPNMVIQMVAIGEESGSIDAMLSKVADFYEEEVDNLVEMLSSLMEPMIMAFLGVVIGGLVVAMYLPIFQMGSVI